MTGKEGKKPHRMFTVEFSDTRYTTEVHETSVSRNNIKDGLYPTVSGVGAIGYASVSDNPKAYHTWASIISRCYNPDAKSYYLYGGKGVKVSERWLRFDHFLEDLERIDGYDLNLFENGKVDLDKDMKQFDLPHEHRYYSLNTCTFISRQDNSAFRNYDKMKSAFTAISPDGKTYEAIGVRQFAKDHGLNHAGVLFCLQGKYKQHKGWKFSHQSPVDN